MSDIQPLLFPCAGVTLVGMLQLPTNEGPTGVVAVTGGPQYRVGSHRHYLHLARSLAAAGYPTLRFDLRGSGDSDGEFAGFQGIEADIRAAIDALLRERPSVRRIVLFGLCDAAAAILLYCGSDARISGLILANPWVRTQQGEARSFVRYYYFRRLLQRAFWQKLLAGELLVLNSVADFVRKLWSASPVKARTTAMEAAEDFIPAMLSCLTQFRGDTLILLSERDLTAGEFRSLCESSKPWRKAVDRPSVSVVDCKDTDHTFSSRRGKVEMAEACQSWLAARLGGGAVKYGRTP